MNGAADVVDLVFAGGGVKGIVHAGAVQELERRGFRLGRLVGTSAGSIVAMLLAAGYDAQGVVDTFSEKLDDGRNRLEELQDIPDQFPEEAVQNSVTYSALSALKQALPRPEAGEAFQEKILHGLLKHEHYRQLFGLVELGGFYGGEAFRLWMQERLENRQPGLGAATLAEFYARTGRFFTAVATDTVAKNRLVLNHLTAPDLPVTWAVRMSMSIPFVWTEVTWDESWGLYRGQDIHGHTIVDGGVVSNFPLDLILETAPDYLQAMGEQTTTESVIGLYIDDDLPVVPGQENLQESKKSLLPDRLAFVQERVRRLIDTTTHAHDRIVINTYPESICRLPAGGYDTLDFKMDEARIQQLVQAGRAAMRDYLVGKSPLESA